jgi:hypothetical protein
VRAAWAPVPLLQPYQDDRFRVTGFARGLASDVRHSMQVHNAPSAGVRLGAGDASASLSTVLVISGEPVVTSDETDASGLRRRTIEVDITVRPGQGNVWSPDQMGDKLVFAVEAQQDTCATGLGRVGSATVLAVQPAGRAGRTARARFEFVSRRPQEARAA